jgi:hypothetical protein
MATKAELEVTIKEFENKIIDLSASIAELKEENLKLRNITMSADSFILHNGEKYFATSVNTMKKFILDVRKRYLQEQVLVAILKKVV